MLPLAQTQEMWSFLVPAAWLALFATPAQWERLRAPANALLVSLFMLHYANRRVESPAAAAGAPGAPPPDFTPPPPLPLPSRDFIFPLRLRGGKPTPFVVWLMAALFCGYNGYMQVGAVQRQAGRAGCTAAGGCQRAGRGPVAGRLLLGAPPPAAAAARHACTTCACGASAMLLSNPSSATCTDQVLPD